jgi:DNA repair protein RadC
MEEIVAVTEIEISYKPRIGSKQYIKSSSDAYSLLRGFFSEDTIALKEQIVVILLNQANGVIGGYRLSEGGVTSAISDPRIIFTLAVKAVASAFVLAHNHPSGNLQPSKADIDLTSKLKDAGRLLDIKFMDHLIIVPEMGRYYSFADEGML